MEKEYTKWLWLVIVIHFVQGFLCICTLLLKIEDTNYLFATARKRALYEQSNAKTDAQVGWGTLDFIHLFSSTLPLHSQTVERKKIATLLAGHS